METYIELLSSEATRMQDVDWNVEAMWSGGRFEDAGAAVTQMMIVPPRPGESRDGQEKCMFQNQRDTCDNI